MVLFKLTTEDRVLLWIYRYMRGVEGSGYVWSAPYELTQKGIEGGLLIRQAYISRTLKKLLSEGMVKKILAHTDNSRRRKNVYILTPSGEEYVDAMIKAALKSNVKVVDSQGERIITLEELRQETGKSPVSLLLELQNGVYKKKEASPHIREGVPQVDEFYGRDGERIKLSRFITSDRKKIMYIYGLPGIGKTTLVAYVLNGLKDYSVIWFRGKEWIDFDRFLMDLANFLRAFGYQNEVDAETIVEFMNNLQTQIIIVLDDFQEIPEVSARKIFDFVHRIEKKSILISREVMPDVIQGGDVEVYHLKGLDKNATFKLLSSYATAQFDKKKVYDLTGGHPLAIKLIALSGEMRHNPRDLIDYVRTEVIQKLSPDQRNIIKLLSVFNESIRLPLLIHTISAMRDKKSMVDGLKNIPMALESLKNRGLIKEEAKDVYSLHSLISEITYLSMDKNERKRFHTIAKEYYHLAVVEGDFWGLRAKEISMSVIAYIYHSINSEDYRSAITAGEIYGLGLIRSGYRYPITLLKDIPEEKLSPSLRIRYILMMGDLHLISGDHDTARDYYLRAIKMKQKHKSSGIEIEIGVYHRMARANATIGRIKPALDYMKKAMEIAENSDDPKIKSKVWNNRGVIYSLIGDLEEAERSYKKAIEFAASAREGHGEGIAHGNLGKLYLSMNRVDDGIRHLEHAMEKLNHNDPVMAEIMEVLADAYTKKNRLERALRLYEEVMKHYKKYGPSSKYYMPLVKAYIIAEKLRIPERDELLKDIRKMFIEGKWSVEEIEDEKIRAFITLLEHIARAPKIGPYSWIATMPGDGMKVLDVDVAKLYSRIAVRLYSEGYPDQALRIFKAIHSVAERNNDIEGLIRILWNVAVIQIEQEDFDSARRTINSLKSLAHSAGSVEARKKVTLLIKYLRERKHAS